MPPWKTWKDIARENKFKFIGEISGKGLFLFPKKKDVKWVKMQDLSGKNSLKIENVAPKDSSRVAALQLKDAFQVDKATFVPYLLIFLKKDGSYESRCLDACGYLEFASYNQKK